MKWFLFLLFFPLTVFSYCFDMAGKVYGVPSHVLWAIAKVESGFNPRALNRNRNGTVDVGLMQINSSWFGYLKKYNIPIQHLWDPCTNVLVGAMILRHCMNIYGLTWKAVDCYNKGNKAQQSSKYVWQVYRAIQRSFRD